MERKDLFTVVFESIERDLAYYRGRQVNAHFYMIACQVILLIAYSTVTTTNDLSMRILFTIGFAFIARISLQVTKSYLERVHDLWRRRELLLKQQGLPEELELQLLHRQPSISHLGDQVSLLVAALFIITCWLT